MVPFSVLCLLDTGTHPTGRWDDCNDFPIPGPKEQPPGASLPPVTSSQPFLFSFLFSAPPSTVLTSQPQLLCVTVNRWPQEGSGSSLSRSPCLCLAVYSLLRPFRTKHHGNQGDVRPTVSMETCNGMVFGSTRQTF